MSIIKLKMLSERIPAEDNWVLLYLCRTERMLIICGDKINILPTCHQQTTHILPSPTTYLQIPNRINADRMWA